MSQLHFPVVNAMWAGALDILVLQTEDKSVWSINPETKNAAPHLLFSDKRFDEMRDVCKDAVLMSGWEVGWTFVQTELDDNNCLIPLGFPVPIPHDTSNWTDAYWLEYPNLFVRAKIDEGGYKFLKVNVRSGEVIHLLDSKGEMSTSTRGGFCLDQAKQSVALFKGFEIPIFDLDSMQKTDLIEPRIAVFFASEAVYRAENKSIMRASYQGLYKSHADDSSKNWSIEHPSLFNVSILGFSQSLQAYILLNDASDRIGIVREQFEPVTWWRSAAGSISIPSDHGAVRMNARGDKVLLLRSNKSVNVLTIC